MADDKKNEATPKTPTTKPAEPKAPPPTQEQLDSAFEKLVVKLEGLGHRDDPDVAQSRAMLDNKAGGKDAPKGG